MHFSLIGYYNTEHLTETQLKRTALGLAHISSTTMNQELKWLAISMFFLEQTPIEIKFTYKAALQISAASTGIMHFQRQVATIPINKSLLLIALEGIFLNECNDMFLTS